MSEDADTRTEAASPKRHQQARARGQTGLSPEATGFVVLAATAVLLVVVAPRASRMLMTRLVGFLALDGRMEPAAALHAAGMAALLIAGPFLIGAVVAGLLATFAQTGGMMHIGALLPDLSRLDPRRGLSRILSPAALLEGGKSLLKLAAAGTAVWSVLSAVAPQLPSALYWEPTTLLDRTGREVLNVLIALLAAQGVIAAIDVMRARQSHASSLRMTRQEVRDELKEADGDPHVKGRIRRLRAQRARRRMLATVPRAVVVVTNPTHYAVALAYDRNGGGAPRVVAKGVDTMAERIRALAREHGVPLVANPPLARALYPSALDVEIPRELFQAVAELIAYVWRIQARAR